MINQSSMKPSSSKVDTLFKLVKDTLLFYLLSFYYILEAIFLTCIPDGLRPLKKIEDEVVLITGGGGGVGSELALRMARLGAKVIIWDINKDSLTKTKTMITREGYSQVYEYVVDLSDKQNVYATAEKVKKEVGKVDILINNAGIVHGKTLLELSDGAIEDTYKVNILSHYWTVRSFLPAMIEDKKGHIVTMGSVAGLLGTYLCTDYSATKFATVGFHESLFTELKAHGHNNIHATLVCPYYINTGMFHGVTPRLMPMLEPAYVAEAMVQSIRKNEVNCTLPSSVRYLLPLKCLLPAKMCWELMNRVMKGPQTMMEFKGKPAVAVD